MGMLNLIILAIVQGLTEFLPISSSGHLAILQNIFQEVNVSLDVFLHLATLLAVIVYFYKDILNIIKDFFTWKKDSQNFRIAIYLIIASIPAAIVGLLFKKYIEGVFSNIILIAFGFIITSLFLFSASTKANYPQSENKPLTLKNTFVIGIAQALAIFPGISRSGSTSSTGILLNLSKKDALKFSFLLAIPAILGASILEIRALTITSSILIPFVLAFFSGLLGIYLFMNKISIKNLKYFGYYCLFIGLALLIIKSIT
jgi:undecaprenyl-diphosphatase